jgi:plastocyanin
MTDTTTTEPEQPETPAEVEPAADAAVETPPPAEKPNFWARPYVERYLTPLLLPLACIFFVLVYVLNVSRLFLSMHGHIPVIAGTIITVLIILGASMLAKAELRQSGVLLLTIGFLVAISFAGWISLGHSENKEAGGGTLPGNLKTTQQANLVAAPGGALVFNPNDLNVKTGLVKFTVDFQAPGHTFGFHDPTTEFGELKPTGAGPLTGVAYFGKPGDYTFYCSIDGHEAAGMRGTVHVTGPPVTLDQALKDAGNPPGAAGGGSSGG